MWKYPILVGEIAKRGIKKKAIASELGITGKTLNKKLEGVTDFTWPEVCCLHGSFFPDVEKDYLFKKQE